MATNSAEADDEYIIRITHFVNPHQFYFKYEDELFDPALIELENKIHMYATAERKQQSSTKSWEFKKGDNVAVLSKAWTKWIRAEIDEIVEKLNGEIEYTLWSIDHGVPLTSTRNWIIPLPNKYATYATKICVGGLIDCVPAEKQLDFLHFDTMNAEMVKITEWSENAISSLSTLIDDAVTVRFIVQQEIADIEHLFGTLEIVSKSEAVLQATDVLLKIYQTIKTSQFFDELSTLHTYNHPRWMISKGSLSDEDAAPLTAYLESAYPIESNTKVIEKSTNNKILEWNKRNDPTGLSSSISVEIPDCLHSDQKHPMPFTSVSRGTKNLIAKFKKVSMASPDDAISTCALIGGEQITTSGCENFECKETAMYSSDEEIGKAAQSQEVRLTPSQNHCLKKTVPLIPSGYECDVQQFQKDNLSTKKRNRNETRGNGTNIGDGLNKNGESSTTNGVPGKRPGRGRGKYFA